MLALTVAARWYGAGWWHNPGLWGTSDGLPEYRQFWGWYSAIGAGRAWDRLDMARAQSLVQADAADRRRIVAEEQRIASGG